MIKRLFNKIKLACNPIKTGDVYLGNPKYFVNDAVEQTLHGLRDIYGNTIHKPIPNENCYSLKILPTAHTGAHVCSAKVLCNDESNVIANNYIYAPKWMERVQFKKIHKKIFQDLIVSGILKKEKV